MSLILSSSHFQKIFSHGETSYPNECCGLLLGHKNQQTKTVMEIWPAENAWQTEADEYWPEQTEFTEEKRS